MALFIQGVSLKLFIIDVNLIFISFHEKVKQNTWLY